MPYSSEPGHIGWVDLTVEDATGVRDFYARVAGWRPEPVDVGDHADYNMVGADGEPIAGVCHALGVNAALPPVWLVYINVTDLDVAMAEAGALGGQVIDGPRGDAGEPRIAVLRDPAGAAFALVEALK